MAISIEGVFFWKWGNSPIPNLVLALLLVLTEKPNLFYENIQNIIGNDFYFGEGIISLALILSEILTVKRQCV